LRILNCIFAIATTADDVWIRVGFVRALGYLLCYRTDPENPGRPYAVAPRPARPRGERSSGGGGSQQNQGAPPPWTSGPPNVPPGVDGRGGEGRMPGPGFGRVPMPGTNLDPAMNASPIARPAPPPPTPADTGVAGQNSRNPPTRGTEGQQRPTSNASPPPVVIVETSARRSRSASTAADSRTAHKSGVRGKLK